MEADTPKKKQSLTDWMRANLQWLRDPFVDFFIRLGIHPNYMTMLGFLGNVVGAAFLARGWISWGGVMILLSTPFDALDGAMARKLNQPTKFGAFVDSVTDRWSEMLILFGLLYYYLSIDDPLAWMYCLLVFAATMGSVMVSYTKARAEALGFECNVGILTRVERYLILAPALLFNVPWLALWILAIFANVTAIQRALYVRSQAYSVNSK